jgi:hypothetical protein
MALRELFRPLRPDLDKFLFAEVGAERNGIPLSMVSALARLGLDPWDEAGRLSSLGKREAVEQLARLIAEVPDLCRPLTEAREIADGLIEQLPKHDRERPPLPARTGRRYHWPTWLPMPRQSQFLIFCVVAAVAALVSILLHGGFPFGLGSL